MVCLYPMWLDKQGIPVPCGRCLACKIQRTHAWAARLSFERTQWKDAAFITLTYADRFRPPTLKPKDLQDYIKRLRQALWRKDKRKIKYFACGEYGEKHGNCHYHIIAFGVNPVADRELIKEEWPYCDWQLLEQTFRGRKAIGTVTYDSCRYVAGYVQKKLYGEKAKEAYNDEFIAPFVRMSKGIGLQFAKDNETLIKDNLCIGLRGYQIAVPRYFRDKLGISSEDMKRKHFELVADKYAEFKEQAKAIGVLPKRKVFAWREYADPNAERFRVQRQIDLSRKMSLMSDEEYDV